MCSKIYILEVVFNFVNDGGYLGSVADELDRNLYLVPIEVILLFLNELFVNKVNEALRNCNGSVDSVLEEMLRKVKDDVCRNQEEVRDSLWFPFRVVYMYLNSEKNLREFVNLIKRHRQEIKKYAEFIKYSRGSIYGEYIKVIEELKFFNESNH